VIADAQSVTSDLSVVLPQGAVLTVRLTSKAGRAIASPELRLLPGVPGDGAVVLSRFGFSRPVSLAERQETLEDGRIRFTGLPAGRYSLLGRAAGHALAGLEIDLNASQEVTLPLDPETGLLVHVTDRPGRPVRAAAVYVELRDQSSQLGDMPVPCGQTDATGRLAARGVPPGRVRLSARHPRYGWVHAEARLPGPEVQLVFDEPGAIEGVLTDRGQVPQVGKWTIVGERRMSGAMPEVPRLAAPDAEGAFAIRGLQPGEYVLRPIDSVSAYKTPGALVQRCRTRSWACWRTRKRPGTRCRPARPRTCRSTPRRSRAPSMVRRRACPARSRSTACPPPA
jgi:hypothetical protein